MVFCTNCGSQVADGIKFCPSCGKDMMDGNPVQPPQAATVIPPVQQPAAAVTTVFKEKPISTGGYIGILFLMMIPVLNILLLIIWACGGCNRENKRNLSRALLFWMLIGTLIGGIFVLLGGLLFSDQLDALKELVNNLNIQQDQTI